MAIFRCHSCDEIFDVSEVNPKLEVCYCNPCGDELIEKLKPKRIKHDIWASDSKPNPKHKEKKAKKNGK